MIRTSDIDCYFKEIGDRVRRRRKLLKLRIRDLSLISGLTAASISHIERGARDVRLSSLLALAHALRVEPWQLLVDDDSSEDKQNSLPLPKSE